MQLVADGPDIPLAVLAEQEEGELVFFCGAGVSIPSGLPAFAELTRKLFERVGISRTDSDDVLIDRGEIDQVLAGLEANAGVERFRESVCQLLQHAPDADTRTHGAIVDLSTDRAGRLKLVTTNFDVLFETARPGIQGRVAIAPRLPVPKRDRWNSLVHLHGCIRDYEDIDHHNLVLTSADFGGAYLTERWASRFVSELFGRFTIVFVGYSLKDPLMRYLVDAIAAERKVDSRIRLAYAFAPFAPGKQVETETGWRNKGIEPISYPERGNHALLHQTLGVWAGLSTSGLRSRINYINDYARADPATLSRDQVSQFVWALSDSAGVGARHFSARETSANYRWLTTLEELRMLPASASNAMEGASSIVSDVRGGAATRRLDEVRRALSAWLARGIGDSLVVRWVVGHGGALHPELASFVRAELESLQDLALTYRRLWTALSGTLPIGRAESDEPTVGIAERISTHGWEPVRRFEVLSALSPWARIRPPIRIAPLEADDAEPGQRMFSVLDVDFELESAFPLELALTPLRSLPNWSEVLDDIAFDVAILLRRCMDMQAAFDLASNERDLSFLAHPSIAPHPQNRFLDAWVHLIDLNREAIEVMARNDPSSCRALVNLWLHSPYPVFRRLVLFALRIGAGVRGEDVFTVVQARPELWMWSLEVQVELFAAIPALWGGLAASARESLVDLILQGPLGTADVPESSPQERESLADHAVWARLARIQQNAGGLTSRGLEHLARLEAAHQDWRLDGTERQGFPAWAETGWGNPTEYSSAVLEALSDTDLLDLLRTHTDFRRGLLESWAELLRRDTERALRMRVLMVSERVTMADLWATLLEAVFSLDGPAPSCVEVADHLGGVPTAAMGDPQVARVAADAIKRVGICDDAQTRARLLGIWDSALPAGLSESVAVGHDVLGAAINSALGSLTEALFAILISSEPRRASGLPAEISSRLSELLVLAPESGLLARSVVLTRLSLLHEIDELWAVSHLVPLLDWSNPHEAVGAWQGFVAAPRIRPSLWSAIKHHFLVMCGHLSDLDRYGEWVPGIFASVAIEGDDALSQEEATQVLRLLGDSGRAGVAFWIQKRLEGAGDRAATLWRDRIGPWIARAWLPEPRLRGPVASERLVFAVTRAEAAFSDAVEVVHGLMAPVANPDLVVHVLTGAGLPSREPEACLKLASAIIDDRGSVRTLQTLLDEVRRVRPDLVSSSSYRRLEDIALAS